MVLVDYIAYIGHNRDFFLHFRILLTDDCMTMLEVGRRLKSGCRSESYISIQTKDDENL